MAEKVTRMLIKVDLQCRRCYKKIKKVLSKFPQIRDQIYNEKQNTVLITVACYSPEKIRQMLICKGGETVKSVEILLDKPKERRDPADDHLLDVAPPKEITKSSASKSGERPDKDKSNIVTIDPSMPSTTAPPTAPPTVPPAPAPAPAPAPPPPPPEVPMPPKPKPPVVGYPPVPVYPMVPVYLMVPLYPMVGVCCCPPGYGGHGGGSCYCGRRRPVTWFDGCGRPADECQCGNGGSYHGQGKPVLCDDGCGRPANECQGGTRGSYLGLGRPVMCNDGCGRLACECRDGNRGCCASRCDYFSEENATGCTVM